MDLFFLHLPIKNRKDEPGEYVLVADHQPPHSTSEGGEILDDVIRVVEQPLIYPV